MLGNIHGGIVLDAIINYLDKYSSQIFVLQMGLLVILSAIILWVYFYNRKKYHNLKHQIPASVVKNYLDSIIQNSNALKSSLFRGGGLDVDPSSIPSVMPVGDLPSSSPVSVSIEGGDEALKAEIARLQSQLAVKDNAIKDLEAKATDLSGVVKQKQERIEELEALLKNAGDGNDDGLASKLAEVTAERDKLKEDLAQYAVIEDDLADLKRLRQENEQLKASLNGGDPIVDSFSEPASEPVAEEPAAADPEPEPTPEPAAEVAVEEPVAEEAAPEEPVAEEAAPEEPVAEEAAAEEPAAEEPAAEEPAAEEPAAEEVPAAEAGADKSPEDLLREFEKMLG